MPLVSPFSALVEGPLLLLDVRHITFELVTLWSSVTLQERVMEVSVVVPTLTIGSTGRVTESSRQTVTICYLLLRVCEMQKNTGDKHDNWPDM